VPLHRRTLLARAGAALVAAPFASLLSSTRARAQAAGPKNLLVFFSPNGTIHRHWRPQHGADPFSFTFAPGSILEPLEDVRQHVTILDELNLFSIGGNHEGGMRAMLTGENLGEPGETAGLSVDQFIARAISSGARFPSLELGVQTSAWGGSVQTRMSYAGREQLIAPDDRPQNVYARLFADVAGGPDEALKLRRRRQSVLDVVRADLSDLSRRLGASEKHKLEVHTESLRSVERSLDAAIGGGTCAAPTAPTLAGTGQNDDFPTALALQRDLAVLSLSCGLTRVASIQCSHTVSPTLMSWLGVPDGHHALSHADDGNDDGVDAFVRCERWFAEQFRDILLALQAQPSADGAGTLLDDTLVVWTKELGDSRLHDSLSVPFVVAGGGTTGGRALRCGGRNHNELLVWMCQRFGLTNETFGDPAGGVGPLEVLL
jgi:hypothetical protein